MLKQIQREMGKTLKWEGKCFLSFSVTEMLEIQAVCREK